MISVYDGDTLTLELDLGFNLYLVRKARICGIDTPEMRGWQKPAGTIVRDYCRGLVEASSSVVYYSHSPHDKYGRSLGDVYLAGIEEWLGSHLVRVGMALPYDGGRRDATSMETLCECIINLSNHRH